MEPLKCEECGRVITAGSKRCAYCGCPVEVMLGSTNTAGICPKCGKSVEKNMNYCPNCGEQQHRKTKSASLLSEVSAKRSKSKSKNTAAPSEKKENKISTDNLEVPMPPKPKFRKGFITYTIVIFGLVVSGIVNAHILSFLMIFLSPVVIYTVVYKSALNEYSLAQKDYPKYVMKIKAKREKERVRIEKAQVAAEERRVREEAQRAKEKAIIEAEYNAAILSQHRQEPWAVRYSTSPCPYCGHYKVRHAKWEDKSISVAFWGMASSTIGKNYKCEHCGRMW